MTDLPAGFRREQHDVNGTQVSVVVGGRGPTVVLLHGWPQTSRAWRHQLAPLAGLGYSVVAPDLRGTGCSARAEGGYDKDNQVEDVRQLVDALGLGPNVRLVGHDIGGMVAFSYARTRPEEVERLVLLELAVPGLGLEEAMDVAHGGLWHFGFFHTPEVASMLMAGHEREFFPWWFAGLARDPAALDTTELEAVITAYSGRESLDAGFGHYRTLLDDGRTNRAWLDAGGRLGMPVLTVGGQYGVGGGLADSVHPAAPTLKSAVIAGSGHFVPEEAPEALMVELEAFLA